MKCVCMSDSKRAQNDSIRIPSPLPQNSPPDLRKKQQQILVCVTTEAPNVVQKGLDVLKIGALRKQ